MTLHFSIVKIIFHYAASEAGYLHIHPNTLTQQQQRRKQCATLQLLFAPGSVAKRPASRKSVMPLCGRIFCCWRHTFEAPQTAPSEGAYCACVMEFYSRISGGETGLWSHSGLIERFNPSNQCKCVLSVAEKKSISIIITMFFLTLFVLIMSISAVTFSI